MVCKMLRNMCRHYFVLLLYFFSLLTVGGVPPARAAQEIVLIADQSKVVKLSQVPATLLVGNPAVADVTIDGNSLFLHPRGYGLTKIVALDAKGAQLGDFLVRVIFEDSYSVSMYSPGGRETFSCRRDCEPSMRIGDESSFFQNYASQVNGKNDLAFSQSKGEDVMPPSTMTTPITPVVTPTSP